MPQDSAPPKQRVVIDVDKVLLKRIDHIAVDWDRYRKEAIEVLLEIAVGKVEAEGAEKFMPET